SMRRWSGYGSERRDRFPLRLRSERVARAADRKEIVRRLVDIALSSFLLVVLAPVMVLVAAAVRLDSPGPILFRQVRTGRNRRRTEGNGGNDRRRRDVFGKPFTLYKFRTMYADARERFPDLYKYQYSEIELRTIPNKVLVVSKRGVAAAVEDIDVASLHGYQDPRVT